MSEHDFFQGQGASGAANPGPGDEKHGPAKEQGNQPDADRVMAIGHRVIEQVVEIPEFKLTGPERMYLSSHLFKEAPEFISSVADAMEREPALFAHFGFSGKALDKKLDRSLALSSLSSLFQKMADSTRDLALYEQADAIQTAMTVVRQVRGENALPIVPPGAEDRKMALTPAEKALRARQNHKKDSANRRRRAVKRAEAPFAAAPASSTAAGAGRAAHGGSGGGAGGAAGGGAAGGGVAGTGAGAAGRSQPRQKARPAPANPFIRRQVDDILSHWNAYRPSAEKPANDQAKDRPAERPIDSSGGPCGDRPGDAPASGRQPRKPMT